MKKSLSIFALLLLLVLAFGVASCKKTDAQKVQPEKLCYDIQKIQLDMEYSALKDLYDPEPFEQLKADVMAGKIDRKECIFRLKEIFCAYHVVHLRLAVAQDNHDFSSGIFPFETTPFTRKTPDNAPARPGDLLLGEDFSEMVWGPHQEIFSVASGNSSWMASLTL